MSYYLEVYTENNSCVPLDYTNVATFSELLIWFREKIGPNDSSLVKRFITCVPVTAEQTAALLPNGGYLEIS